MSGPANLFRYVLVGAVAGLDLALWVTLAGRLVG
jgi:hypothetical protein